MTLIPRIGNKWYLGRALHLDSEHPKFFYHIAFYQVYPWSLERICLYRWGKMYGIKEVS